MADPTVLSVGNRLVPNPFKMGVCRHCGQHTLVTRDDMECSLWGCLEARKHG